MTVILHIGTHKTGTTSVQAFARNHRVELRERGLWYPGFEEVGLGARSAHHLLANAWAMPERSSISEDQAEAFIHHVRLSKRAREIVLFSAENFYGHLCDLREERRPAYIERVRRGFRDDDVRVVMVCRSQGDLAGSLYQERVKAARYPFDYREYLKRDRHWFEYYRHASVFRELFDTVEVWRFEDLAKEDFVGAFFRKLGIEVRDLDREHTAKNRSLPLELIEFKLLLNRTAIGDPELDSVRGLLNRLSNMQGESAVEREAWTSKAEAVEFAASFDAENERLRQSYAPGIPPPLFPAVDPESAAPAVYQRMTAQRFAELAVELLQPLRAADRFQGQA